MDLFKHLIHANRTWNNALYVRSSLPVPHSPSPIWIWSSLHFTGPVLWDENFINIKLDRHQAFLSQSQFDRPSILR